MRGHTFAWLVIGRRTVARKAVMVGALWGCLVALGIPVSWAAGGQPVGSLWSRPRGDSANTAYANGVASAYKLLWQVPWLINGPTSVDIDGDSIYANEGSAVFCLSTANGQARWSRSLSNPAVPLGAQYRCTGITIAGARVLIGVSSASGPGIVYALNKSTGAVEWSDQFPGQILSTPVVWDDRILVRAGFDVILIDASKGFELSSTPMPGPQTDMATKSGDPATDGQAIYFNSDLGEAFCVDPPSTLRWVSDTAGIVRTGAFPFIRASVKVTSCAPMLDGSRILAADGASNCYAFDCKTGSRLWAAATDGIVYQFARNADSCFAATSSGFYRLDSQTGHLTPLFSDHGGVLWCAVSDRYAVLAPTWNATGGLVVIDVRSDKEVWADKDFYVRSPVAVSSRVIFAVGTNGRAPNGPGYLRAYTPVYTPVFHTPSPLTQ